MQRKWSFVFVVGEIGETMRLSVYCRQAVTMKQSLLVQFCTQSG